MLYIILYHIDVMCTAVRLGSMFFHENFVLLYDLEWYLNLTEFHFYSIAKKVYPTTSENHWNVSCQTFLIKTAYLKLFIVL